MADSGKLLATTILHNLILNESYSRKTLAFIKPEYFKEPSEQKLFSLISEYTQKYSSPPSKEALLIDLENASGVTEEVFEQIQETIKDAEIDEKTNLDFLVSKTEDYCKDQAIYNALVESISIIDGKKDSTGIAVGQIPKLLEDALGVCFDTNVGHDFVADGLSRYDIYHERLNKIPFHIEFFNKITKGGMPRKTLSCILSNQTGGGKTLTMCDMAANNLMEGFNVLYITMEMSEIMIAKRIDANLMNFTLDELDTIPKSSFEKRYGEMKAKIKGKLIIKEYPTGAAHSGHFRHLVHELKAKQGFVPDVIYVDYLNICSSARVKMSGSVNTYTYVKTIAEELRALSIETNTMMMTATQGNRSALGSSDIGLENTSESIGLPATLDMMLGIMTSEELDDLGAVMFKQLKNRYGPIDIHRRFLVGIDRNHMRLYNLDEEVSKKFIGKDIADKDEGPVMDKTTFGKKDDAQRKKNFTSFE